MKIAEGDEKGFKGAACVKFVLKGACLEGSHNGLKRGLLKKYAMKMQTLPGRNYLRVIIYNIREVDLDFAKSYQGRLISA